MSTDLIEAACAVCKAKTFYRKGEGRPPRCLTCWQKERKRLLKLEQQRANHLAARSGNRSQRRRAQKLKLRQEKHRRGRRVKEWFWFT